MLAYRGIQQARQIRIFFAFYVSAIHFVLGYFSSPQRSLKSLKDLNQKSLIQRVLALCEFHYFEFHYCAFSKKSITFPYANLCLLLGLFYFIFAIFLAIFTQFWRILANANFFQNQKSHQPRTLCILICLAQQYLVGQQSAKLLNRPSVAKSKIYGQKLTSNF